MGTCCSTLQWVMAPQEQYWESWAGETCVFSDHLDKEILLKEKGWGRVVKRIKLCVLLVHRMKSIFAFCPPTRCWKRSEKVRVYSKR